MSSATLRFVSRLPAVLAVLAAAVGPRSAAAQDEYRDTHSGHPVRIEDAVLDAPGHLDMHLPGFRADRLDAGPLRWRFSPEFDAALSTRTSVEVVGSFLWLEPGTRPRGGLSGVDLAASRALLGGATSRQAVAATVDVFLPAGVAGSGAASASLRLMASVVRRAWRAHANVSLGNYNVAVVNPAAACGPNNLLPKLGYGCDGSPPPVIPGGPCAISPQGGNDNGPPAVLHCGSIAADFVNDTLASLPATLPRRGVRWFAGLAVDHDLPRVSTLLVADVYASALAGVQPMPDWAADIGVRHQLSGSLVLDGAIGRRFAGSLPGWSVNAGLTRSIRWRR